ncbi:MAG: DNA repair protein RecO [Lachnospiraceae bacterium]|nr:DNA repair protein RecO [Lachnospiraceae bacterium]
MTPQSFVGMVISSQNIGETDRRIVLLTRERGRISAFARGAVKPKNPLVSATQPFTFGEFYVYPGKDSYTVTGAEISKYFDFARKSLDKYYYASYMCELAAYYTRENLDAEDVLLLLYQSFRALEKDTIENELIRYIYEWRMLLINGEVPDVYTCRGCGKNCENEPYYFSVKRHGILCQDCLNGERGDSTAIQLRNATVYTLRFILSSPLKTLYTFRVSEEVLAEIRRITDEYIKANRNYKFNSLWFLTMDQNE